MKMLGWLILFFRIAGLGGNFSAGYDLGELAKIEEEDIANELVRYFSTCVLIIFGLKMTIKIGLENLFWK